ncbi:hypothetical protein Gogos_011897 [Gossypium gossypioides]|uniref:Uncharacterized protein n=1 Tax=Gossypium gossypioides TaxID=34282 RepID=A0A7J9BQX0_GOSGO|nr:hypothetical protein [Gossypium gossypioides]
MLLVAQAMDLTGTIVGDGDQALKVDGLWFNLCLSLEVFMGLGQIPIMVMGL